MRRQRVAVVAEQAQRLAAGASVPGFDPAPADLAAALLGIAERARETLDDDELDGAAA